MHFACCVIMMTENMNLMTQHALDPPAAFQRLTQAACARKNLDFKEKTITGFKAAEGVVGLTFSSEVQVVFDPPLPLLQLLGHLSVLPAWKHTNTRVTTGAHTNSTPEPGGNNTNLSSCLR